MARPDPERTRDSCGEFVDDHGPLMVCIEEPIVRVRQRMYRYIPDGPDILTLRGDVYMFSDVCGWHAFREAYVLEGAI